MKTCQAHAQVGFTLMESVVALLLLSIVSTVIISLNGNLFLHSTSAHDQQQSTQLLQSCVDQLLAQRKTEGYDTTFSCNHLASLAPDYSLTVTPETPTTCPPQVKCKQLAIRATHLGVTTAPITLLLAKD